MKKCPYCAEEIQDNAIICRFCNRSLEKKPNASVIDSSMEERKPNLLKWVFWSVFLGVLFFALYVIMNRYTNQPPAAQILPPSTGKSNGSVLASTIEPTKIQVKPTATRTPVRTKSPIPTSTTNAREQMMAQRVEELFEDKHITSIKGTYKSLPDYDESWAQIDWFQWHETGIESDAFIIRTDVSWESASTTANHFNSGCGFVFNEIDNDNFYMVYLGLDGNANIIRFLRGYYDANWHKYYGKVGNPKGEAEYLLAVQNGKFIFLVDDKVALSVSDTKVNGKKLGLTINSGTNKDFGTHCLMENIDLWFLE